MVEWLKSFKLLCITIQTISQINYSTNQSVCSLPLPHMAEFTALICVSYTTHSFSLTLL